MYKALIASNCHTLAFDFAYGKTPASAAAAVKRRNSPDWRDCIIWVLDADGRRVSDY